MRGRGGGGAVDGDVAGGALALDAATDEDMSEDQGGFTFCINKELLAQVEGVKIDLSYSGFTVEPTVPLPQAGGGCSSCSGGCGH